MRKINPVRSPSGPRSAFSPERRDADTLRQLWRRVICIVTLISILFIGATTSAGHIRRPSNAALQGSDAAAPQIDEPKSMNWLGQAIEFGQQRMVKVYGAGAGRVNSYATGIIVSPHGQIVTTQGVFLDGDQVRVALPDGQLIPASVIRRDRKYQLALLQVSHETPDYFELSNELVGDKGDWVVALSNAFMVAERDEPMSATLGVISLVTSIEARLNKDNVAYQGELVLIDAITSNPGAGGGAVLLPDGRLVGMIGKVINSSDTNTRLNYAVPSRILKRFLAGELADEEPQTASIESVRPTLGLELFKHGGKSGPAYIDRVIPDGPAAEAGLKADDLIVSLGGEKVGSIRDYERLLPTLHVGNETVLVVKRGQELLRISITPAAEK